MSDARERSLETVRVALETEDRIAHRMKRLHSRELRVVKIGGTYDAASANGWHVVRPIVVKDEIPDAPPNALLIVDGPFPTKAQAEMRRKVIECQ